MHKVFFYIKGGKNTHTQGWLDFLQKSCWLESGSTVEVLTEADCYAVMAATACEK